MLTDRDCAGLILMFECIFHGKKNDKVKVNFNRNKGIHFAIAKLKDLDTTVFLQEQNPHRSSIFASAAQHGIAIAWPMVGNDYLGPVVAELPGQPVRVYSSDELRLLLNPLVGQLKMDRYVADGQAALEAYRKVG